MRKKHYVIINGLEYLDRKNTTSQTKIKKLFKKNNLPLSWILNCKKCTIKNTKVLVYIVYLITYSVKYIVKIKLSKYVKSRFNNKIFIT
jgi:hypothetical protein